MYIMTTLYLYSVLSEGITQISPVPKPQSVVRWCGQDAFMFPWCGLWLLRQNAALSWRTMFQSFFMIQGQSLEFLLWYHGNWHHFQKHWFWTEHLDTATAIAARAITRFFFHSPLLIPENIIPVVEGKMQHRASHPLYWEDWPSLR